MAGNACDFKGRPGTSLPVPSERRAPKLSITSVEAVALAVRWVTIAIIVACWIVVVEVIR